MAGSFQTAIIKTHSGHSLNEILKETIESGEGKLRDCYVSPRRCQHQTVWCVCGSFYKAFLHERQRKCLPSRSAHQVLMRHVGNELAYFMSAEGRDGGGSRAKASSFTPPGTPRQADYGVVLTRTNCLSLRSEQILLWISLWWIKKERKENVSAVCLVPLCFFYKAADFSHWS